jgi:MFS family permease
VAETAIGDGLRGDERVAVSTIARGVVPLIALAIFINYIDRGNLATASPLIQKELGLSNTAIGFLISAFFFTYTPGQLLAGWLAEKLDPYRTLALGLALWSLATMATGFATGFASLIALRLVLGLGESAAFPCSAKLFAQHLPTHRLGATNGLMGTGLALGPAFGTAVGGWMMAHTGWRPTFFAFGLASALWLIPWYLATRQASHRARTTMQAPAPSFLAILKKREAWGACLGHISVNYAFYFFISWLPLYLVKARGFTLSEMAVLGGIIYVVYAISAQTTGWLADVWIRSGASETRVRKTFAVGGHFGMTACFLACVLGGASVSLASLFVAGIFFGFNTPTIYAIGQTLGGARGGGKWIALQNCVGNCAGIFGPLLTGFVIDRTGGFAAAFLIASAFALAGAAGWGLIVRDVAPVSWEE